jgi:prepilin-type N-terminal cleavage/methylation domain-containing protein
MNRRRGFTLIEVAAAAAMLAALLLVAAQMLHALSNYQQTIRQRAVALQAVQAVSEQAGNIPWDQLTAESARQLKIPSQLEKYLRGSRLNVVVEDESTATPSKRILVELTWSSSNGRDAAPVRLTSWAFPPPKQKGQ